MLILDKGVTTEGTGPNQGPPREQTQAETSVGTDLSQRPLPEQAQRQQQPLLEQT